MTVLNLTPPQPRLRLVANNPADDTRDTRYRTAASLRGDARVLYQHVLQFALQERIAIEPDALRVVLATKQATSPLPARAFTATVVWQLLFVDVVAWCRNRHLDVPAGCQAALDTAIEALQARNALDTEHGESYDVLCDAVDECTGGGWADDSHPSSTPSAPPRRSLRSKRGPKRI